MHDCGKYTVFRYTLLSNLNLSDQALVKLCSAPDGSKYVHFEAFQCSDQCVKLFKEEKVRGVGSHQGLTRMIQEVWVGNKEDCEVDNDFFLVPVKILDHTVSLESHESSSSFAILGLYLDTTHKPFIIILLNYTPFDMLWYFEMTLDGLFINLTFSCQGPLRSDFPIENRLVLQTRDDLKDHLKKRCRGRTGKFVSGLADFHLILFLSKHLDLNSDIALIIDAITKDKEIQDGYKLIIESIAGLQLAMLCCICKPYMFIEQHRLFTTEKSNFECKHTTSSIRYKVRFTYFDLVFLPWTLSFFFQWVLRCANIHVSL